MYISTMKQMYHGTGFYCKDFFYKSLEIFKMCLIYLEKWCILWEVQQEVG
jgi:hypothetical protein